MGASGAGLFQDDLAVDIKGTFEEALAAGASATEAAQQALASVPDALDDPDDGPMVRLVVASLLLDEGVVDHPVLAEAREVVRAGAGLERWAEQGKRALAARRAAYEEVGARLERAVRGDAPSPVRRRGPRRALPKVGDVLQIPLPDGRYAYGHYIGMYPGRGPLLEVRDLKSTERASLEDISRAGPMFPPVFVGINPPVRSGRWQIIGRLPTDRFTLPLFITRRGGRFWWLVKDGEWEKIGTALPRKYRDLEIDWCVPAEWLEQRILTGVDPERERELRNG